MRTGYTVALLKRKLKKEMNSGSRICPRGSRGEPSGATLGPDCWPQKWEINDYHLKPVNVWSFVMVANRKLIWPFSQWRLYPKTQYFSNLVSMWFLKGSCFKCICWFSNLWDGAWDSAFLSSQVLLPQLLWRLTFAHKAPCDHYSQCSAWYSEPVQRREEMRIERRAAWDRYYSAVK